MPQAKQTASVRITIKKIFENDKGPHKVIDTRGNTWKVWPDKYDELGLEEGQSYAALYTPGQYNGKPDNVIIGAQLATNTPRAAHPSQTNGSDREMDITVNGLAHCVPGWFAQLDMCDSAGVARILDSLEAAWRMHKNKKRPSTALRAQPPTLPTLVEGEREAEFDDEIPY